MLIGAHFMPLLFAALVRPEGGGADDTGFALLFDPDDLSAPEVAEEVPPLKPEQEEDAETPEETALPTPFWWPEPEAAAAPLSKGDAPAPEAAAIKAPLPQAAPEAQQPVSVAVAEGIPVAESISVAEPPPVDTAPIQMPSVEPPPVEPTTPEQRPVEHRAVEQRPTEQRAEVVEKRPAPAEAPRPDAPVVAIDDTLGGIEVVFEQEGDATRITLVAEKADTVDLMRRHADQLLNELSREGFADADLDFAERRQDRPPRDDDADTAPQPAPAAVMLPRVATTGLDLRL